jgi:hypothetical protein
VFCMYTVPLILCPVLDIFYFEECLRNTIALNPRTNMSKRIRNGWILPSALTVYTLALLGMICGVVLYNGHVSYTLDDAYIHMAMAKHVAQDGVFGITPYEFSASSSSPLWTFQSSARWNGCRSC